MKNTAYIVLFIILPSFTYSQEGKNVDLEKEEIQKGVMDMFNSNYSEQNGSFLTINTQGVDSLKKQREDLLSHKESLEEIRIEIQETLLTLKPHIKKKYRRSFSELLENSQLIKESSDKIIRKNQEIEMKLLIISMIENNRHCDEILLEFLNTKY